LLTLATSKSIGKKSTQSTHTSSGESHQSAI
jgi:hypothetical protein